MEANLVRIEIELVIGGAGGPWRANVREAGEEQPREFHSALDLVGWLEQRSGLEAPPGSLR